MLRAWLAVLLLTLLALAALFAPEWQLRLKVDASAEALIGSEQREVSAQDRPLIMIMLEVPDAWSSADVRAVAALEKRLLRLPVVARVESPFTLQLPVVDDFGIDVASLATRLDRYPGESEQWIDRVFSEALISGHLANASQRSVLLRVTLRPGLAKGEDQGQSVADEFQRFLAGQTRYQGTVTGARAVEQAIGQQIMHDLAKSLLLSAIIIPVVLSLSFSGFLAVLLPLMSAAAAILWTLAGMALLGISINLVTAVVPPLVIALTLAYSMHALSEANPAAGEESSARRLVAPLLATGVTTLAGFLALSVQSMAAIRDFSIAGAVGVVASITAVMLIQCYGLQGCTHRIQTRAWLRHRLQSFALKVHGLVVGRRNIVIGAAIAVFTLGILAGLLVEPGARYIRDLPQGHQVRDDFDRISERFGGANSFEIVIEGAGADAVLLPSVLRSISLFEYWLQEQPEIGGVSSLTGYIKRVHQVFTSGEQKDFRIPADFNLIKQLLIVAAPDDMHRYASLDYSRLYIQVRTPLDEVRELRNLLERIEAQIDTLPPGLNVTMRGQAVTLTRTITDLTSGQLTSFALALLAIYLVISAVFASLQMGLRAMLPNLLPIAVYYGLIGLLDIPLSPTIALLACIVLGIAVDDTLFYLVRFNRMARRMASESRAAAETLKEVIGPVTLTTVALVLCFLTLLTSAFESQYVFALLAAFTLIVAWISDLVLTPAIGARSSIVTLWDVLTVDLGTAPQETIPLFKDMTARQARLFALLSRVQKIPAGECFIRVGDPAGDIYVVIEGKAYAWFEQNDQEVHLADFERGNTFGEASTFIRHRTANVTAQTPLRVLAFDPNTLDRIRRRYPKVAALIYRNLSAIQAARLDKTTRRLEEMTGIARAAGAQSGA